MEAQKPAEGILGLYQDPESRNYQIACQCGYDKHAHNIWITTDGREIVVELYWEVTAQETQSMRSPYRSRIMQWCSEVYHSFKYRVYTTYILWTKGYVSHEAEICLSAQQSLNYAAALTNAATDITNYQDSRKDNK